ncbi:hypothetical protein CYMTET_51531, partial [Cymbomonas tetramitiformis]
MTANESLGAVTELIQDPGTAPTATTASTANTTEYAASGRTGTFSTSEHIPSVAELYLTPVPRNSSAEATSTALVCRERGFPTAALTPREDSKTSIHVPRSWSKQHQQSGHVNPYVFRFVGHLRKSRHAKAKEAMTVRAPTKLRFLEASISERNCVQLQENGKALPHAARSFSHGTVIVEAVKLIFERMVHGRAWSRKSRGSRPRRPNEGAHSQEDRREMQENDAILHKFVEAKFKNSLSGKDAQVNALSSVVIVPGSFLTVLWDAFIMLVVSWTLVELPLALLMQAKQDYVRGDDWVTPQHAPTIYYADALFFVDMFIRARTAFTDENMNLEQDPVLVLSHYLDTAFLVDLASYFPLLASVFARGEPFNQLLWSLPRMLRAYRAHTTLESQTFTSNALAGTGKQLLAQLLYFLLLIYWLACGWFVAGSSKESVIWSWWEIVQANTVKAETVNSVFFMTLVYTTFNACLGQDVLSSSGRLNGLVSSDTDAAHLPFEVLDLGYCLFLQIIGLLLVYGTLARVIMFIEKFGASR